MNFNERLNDYIASIDCSAKELAEASGISTAAVSRYRKGERVPDPDGKQLRLLSEGLAKMSGGTIDAQDVQNELSITISGITVDYSTFLSNLNAVLGTLPANNNELARALNFDPSYISRILAGQRRPADTAAFVDGVAHFVSRRCAQNPSLTSIRKLVGENWGAIANEQERTAVIARWLTTNYTPVLDPVNSFLEKLETFSLDDYVRGLEFDKIEMPSTPIQLPTTKTYSSLHEMMNAELDFQRVTALSKSSADVIMFSNMPIDDMATDHDFAKKWLYGVARMLKRGLHLHVVHDTSRPLSEMLLGLELWIPMYMTGQISPYYFEGLRNSVFHYILRVSGTVALQGEAIKDHQDEGRYVLTRNRDEVRYYRKRAERMIEKARPLMRIVTSANADDLAAFRDNDPNLVGSRRLISSTLPIGTISSDLLERILSRNGITGDTKSAICDYAAACSEAFESVVESNAFAIEVPPLSDAEFEEHPPALELSGMFHDGAIPYSREEYDEHLQSIVDFCKQHPNCTISVDSRMPFRNIQIFTCSDHYAMVSKNSSPIIHFLIEHAELVTAFEQFHAPLFD